MDQISPTPGTGMSADTGRPAPGILAQLRPAIVLVVLFTILTGLALPLGFVAAARVAAPFASEGSLVERDGHVVGSALIAQNFADAKYFPRRPARPRRRARRHAMDRARPPRWKRCA